MLFQAETEEEPEQIKALEVPEIEQAIKSALCPAADCPPQIENFL